MGTPDFAVPSLRILVEAGMNIVGVITAPDKPKGRGKQLGTSAIKEYALAQQLNILQPTNLKGSDFLNGLKALNADLQIVVAFRMLPEVVWNMPPMGTFNLHASLLPQYRGAAPINWAIINGEVKTGVTTFLLQHEIDTGQILFQEEEYINPDDDAGILYKKLMDRGSKLVLKTVNELMKGAVSPMEQLKSGDLKTAPKIFKEDCEINWRRSSIELVNFVRGLSPYPTAWTRYNDKLFKLYQLEVADEYSLPAGEWSSDNKTYIRIGTESGAVTLKELQMEGKKRMSVGEFLRGQQLFIA